MTLPELIAAIGAATEPSRELNEEIAALCAPTDDPHFAAFENGRDYPDLYTSSLDAALTLARSAWEQRDMLKAATSAVRLNYTAEDSTPASLWSAIKAALLEALRARQV